MDDYNKAEIAGPECHRTMSIALVETTLVFAGLIGMVLLLRFLFRDERNRCRADDLGTERPCPRCARLNPTHARFCAHCGMRLT